MIYDAFAHLPLYGLEDLGFVGRGEAGDFIWERNTAPGGKLPLNTNGGGLSYMHSGMYGMYALQESVRQMRGMSEAQVPGSKISVCHGFGGLFAASAPVLFLDEPDLGCTGRDAGFPPPALPSAVHAAPQLMPRDTRCPARPPPAP